MGISTADLYDNHHNQVTVADPIFKNYGGNPAFGGAIVTLKVDHDFLLIKQCLQTPGQNQVLVIDGGGSLRCALLGDRLAAMAVENHWAGIIVNGCIRDSREIASLPIGVKAINTCPVRPGLEGTGKQDVVVTFAGVTFTPRHHVYADEDGILVSQYALKDKPDDAPRQIPA